MENGFNKVVVSEKGMGIQRCELNPLLFYSFKNGKIIKILKISVVIKYYEH